MRADDRVALVAKLVEVPIVYPDVLRELELPDEARADDEGGDAALDPVVGRALRQTEAHRARLGGSSVAGSYSPRVARIHAARMCEPSGTA